MTLLDGRQKEHPASKNLSDEVPGWLPVGSRVQVICIITVQLIPPPPHHLLLH